MIQELKTVIGKDAPCNFSPTNRAKLISVGPVHCVLEVSPSQYARGEQKGIGMMFTLRSSIVHNMFFA